VKSKVQLVKNFTSEQKIRIVLEGFRGEAPISELCLHVGVAYVTYYKWSMALLDAGKSGLTLDT
jgi:transposase